MSSAALEPTLSLLELYQTAHDIERRLADEKGSLLSQTALTDSSITERSLDADSECLTQVAAAEMLLDNSGAAGESTMSEAALAQLEADTIRMNLITYPDFITKSSITNLIKIRMIDCPIAEVDYFWRISGDGELQKAFRNELATTVEYLHRNVMSVVDPLSAAIGFRQDSFSIMHDKWYQGLTVYDVLL